jgi:DNA uptake protein ComE-like DNA-binding protein
MKKLSLLLVTSIFINLSLLNCKNISSNVKKNTNSQDEKTNVENSIVLNANLATESELVKLEISPDLVSLILSNRPFLSMHDFNKVLANYNKEELFKKIFVPLNLNTTNEKDFKMIPGVGDRMAHEFEEYRPYKSIQQFKREIGKYVDEIEVSRYLSYVFVPVELNTSSEENIKDLPGVGNKMAHEFVEYRPYMNLNQFRREIGKYVDDKELSRLERLVYLREQ